jgi:hypothetical protein
MKCFRFLMPMRPTRVPFATLLCLLLSAALAGCAADAARSTADCAGISGTYRDRAEAGGSSLAALLLGKAAPDRLTKLEVRPSGLHVAAGSSQATLGPGDFTCTGHDEISLSREASSRIHLPPLIDQTRTVSHVLRGGAGQDLVLSTYSRTTASPYGVNLKGPLQLDSTATWRRQEP